MIIPLIYYLIFRFRLKLLQSVNFILFFISDIVQYWSTVWYLDIMNGVHMCTHFRGMVTFLLNIFITYYYYL
jgi:hypothetical protein